MREQVIQLILQAYDRLDQIPPSHVEFDELTIDELNEHLLDLELEERFPDETMQR